MLRFVTVRGRIRVAVIVISSGAMRTPSADAHASGVLRHRLHGHGFVHHERDHSYDPHPLGLPIWAWAAMLVCVALFAYLAQHIGLQ